MLAEEFLLVLPSCWRADSLGYRGCWLPEISRPGKTRTRPLLRRLAPGSRAIGGLPRRLRLRFVGFAAASDDWVQGILRPGTGCFRPRTYSIRRTVAGNGRSPFGASSLSPAVAIFFFYVLLTYGLPLPAIFSPRRVGAVAAHL